MPVIPISKAHLEKDCSHANSGHDDDRNRANESATSGENNDKAQRSAEQARGNDSPATGLGFIRQGSLILEKAS